MDQAGPTAPQSYAALRDLLHERMPDLATGQHRVAELLLTDPEGTAFRTIAQTAELAQVHQSSVVRFAKSLGLDGYPALVRLCREHLSDQAHMVRRFDQAQRDSKPENLLATVLDHDQQNLARTFSRIDPVQWAAIVELVATAPRVHVIGLRKCLSVAQLLAYLLRLVRPRVHQLAPVTGQLADAIHELEAGEVFIAISIRRYTADTVKALGAARRRGLTTIALTDNAASPLSNQAQHTLLIDCEGVTILRSLTAFVSLVQALSTAVALQLGTQSRSELITDEELLADLHVYTDEPGTTDLR